MSINTTKRLFLTSWLRVVEYLNKNSKQDTVKGTRSRGYKSIKKLTPTSSSTPRSSSSSPVQEQSNLELPRMGIEEVLSGVRGVAELVAGLVFLYKRLTSMRTKCRCKTSSSGSEYLIKFTMTLASSDESCFREIFKHDQKI